MFSVLRALTTVGLIAATLLGATRTAHALSPTRVADSVARVAPLLRQADERARRRDFDGAIQLWQSAIPVLTEDEEAYLYGQLYLVASKLHSDTGWMRILRHDPRGASDAYRRALETLRDGHERHAALIKQRQMTAEVLTNLVNLGFRAFAVHNRGGLDPALRASLGVLTRPHWLELSDLHIPGVAVHHGAIGQTIHRFPVVPDRGPLRRVGRIRNPYGTCTGSLVGRGLVMTNRHCVYNKTEHRPFRPSELTFALEKVRYELALPVRAYVTKDGRNTATEVRQDFHQDWAFLVIDVPKQVKLGYLEVDPSLDDESRRMHDGEVVIAGYSGDVMNGTFMTMHYGCSIRTVHANQFVNHDCETFSGSSGSPIFSKQGGRWRVIGLNACGKRDSAGRATRENCGLSIAHLAPHIARLRAENP